MRFAFTHFGTLHNGQMVPLAYLVRQVTELLPRTVFDLALIHIRLKCPAVCSAHIIENTVEVNVVGVGMNCKEILILALEKFLAQFLADFQCSLRRDLARFEALNIVLREDGVQSRSASSDGFKILACLCRIRAAPVCEYEPAVVGLFGIGDIG